MSEDDVFDGYGVRVILKKDFNVIKETISRIGYGNQKTKTLYQSCHILHKRGEYAIVHFKELFQLDGRDTLIEDEDYSRRNRIAKLLEEWGLVSVVDQTELEDLAPMAKIKVVPSKEKAEWTLITKYSIGGKKVAKI